MRLVVEIPGRAPLGAMDIPDNADILFSECSTVSAESLAKLQQAMTAAAEVSIEIVEGGIDVQVSSRLVHAAIIDALFRRLQNKIAEDEVIRFDLA